MTMTGCICLKFHKMYPIICTDPKHVFCCQGLGGCSWQEQVISRAHNLSHVFQHYMAWNGPGYAPGEAQCFVFSCREGTAAGSKVKVLMWLGGLAPIPHRKGHSLAYWSQKTMYLSQ